ncbi:MAG: hypothetical protein V7609_1942 [Verrucomicrobiota bacterium]
MKTRRYLTLSLVCASLTVGAATVNAQATRTWVSGVGDDVNPCSRTAPCKTFAGAISKTAEGGEINPLDPAGYGAVTITKAMTIDGGTGSGWGSILATGAPNGVVVNVTTGNHVNDAVVILRHLTINGTLQAPAAGGVLTNGINYIKAAQLNVEHCVFELLLGTAIRENSLATTGVLRVDDCTFDSNATAIFLTTSSGTATAQIDNCRFNGGGDGINTTSNAFATVRNCNFAGTAGGNGVARANTGCQINVANSTISNNIVGVNVAGGAIRISNNEFFNNATAIVGTAESANNNKFRGNTTDGAVSNVIVVK